MTVYIYSLGSTEKTEKALRAFATSRGLTIDQRIVEASDELTDPDQREQWPALKKRLVEGDTLVIPSMTTLFAIPKWTDVFVRWAAAHGISVLVAECNLSVTDNVAAIRATARAFTPLEDRVTDLLKEIDALKVEVDATCQIAFKEILERLTRRLDPLAIARDYQEAIAAARAAKRDPKAAKQARAKLVKRGEIDPLERVAPFAPKGVEEFTSDDGIELEQVSGPGRPLRPAEERFRELTIAAGRKWRDPRQFEEVRYRPKRSEPGALASEQIGQQIAAGTFKPIVS